MSFIKSSFKTTNDFGLKNFFANVYIYLSLNILFAGGISLFCAENIDKLLFLYPTGALSVLGYIIILGITLNSLQNRLLNNASWISILPLLSIFLAVEGLFFTPFLVIYTAESIAFAASLSGVLLLSFGILGLFTSVDLSQYHNTFLLGAIAISIVEFLSFFIFNFALNFQITSAGVIFIFLFFIANDMQMLKRLYYRNEIASTNKLALLGSIMMFMNFVVLLQRILILLGNKKER